MLGRRKLAALALGCALGVVGGATLHQVTAARPQGLPPPASGARLYTALCATCHGLGGNGGGGAPALDDGLVVREYPTRSALAAFIRQNMPATAPGTLTIVEARQLAGYIESVNGSPARP